MKTWLIEPRDPLIFRDGRPFDASAGARAKTLPFPFPSTLVGAARTLAGRDNNGHFDASPIKDLLSKKLKGPLLVELSETGEIIDWLFPAPADALMLRHEDYRETAGRLVPLTVLNTPSEAMTDLDGLKLVGPMKAEKGKPHDKAPAFWRQSQFEAWLKEPKVDDNVAFQRIGIAGPGRESRMHVSIGHDSQTAEDGALFQTSGLEFMTMPYADPKRADTTQDEKRKPDYPLLAEAMRLGLAVRTKLALSAGWGHLGGESRVVRWVQVDDSFPACPDEVRRRIKEDKACRLILLTPALFDDGFLPAHNQFNFGGVQATVVAAAVNRYQTVSGWDYDKGLPKPTRRLAPAGSVYFLSFDGDPSETIIESFISAVWMHNVSDDSQDRNDGFGLAALGVWDGKSQDIGGER